MDWADVQISVDLVSAARKHLHFLDIVDNFEKILNNDDLLEHAVKRYAQLWLPLVDEHNTAQIVPPIDVAWMWYCHMLRPLVYRRDCRLILNRTLSHSFVKRRDIVDGTNRAIEIWYEKYPKDGYNIIRNGDYIPPSQKIGQLTDAAARLTVKLPVIAKSQMHFCYQVALPHFRDKQFLETALIRYKQFLCLKKLNPDAYLTPPVDILLMWYTHMCYPVEYAIDTMKVCGRVLENNVRMQIGTVTEKFRSASQQTCQSWSAVFKEPLFQPGTKLRVRDLRSKTSEMMLENLKSCCVVVYKLSLNHAELIGLPTKKRRIRVKLVQERFDSTTDEVLYLKGSKRRRLWGFRTAVSYITNIHSGLRGTLTQHSKLLCMKGENTLATGTLKLTPLLESIRKGQDTLLLNIEMDALKDESTPNLLIDGKIEHTKPEVCNLKLVNPNQGFEDTIMGPEQLLEHFGRSTLADNRRSHRCFFQTVKLKNHENKECFLCRIVHIPEQLLSAIQVFFYDRLMTTAYVIGSSQLPLPNQVENRDLSMAFDRDAGERAMLIRNSNGDWGLCIGCWTKEDADEFLKIRFTRLSEVKVEALDVDTAQLHFQSFKANLHTGTIDIDPRDNTVCESIALILSISVLHVLCAPENTERRMKSKSAAVQQLKQNITAETQSMTAEGTVLEYNCALLIAAGLRTSTPNNEYILQNYGSLSADLTFDAQEVFIEEVKVESSLFEQDSKLSDNDYEEYQRRLEQDKSSKLAETIFYRDTKEVDVSKPNTKTREAKSASSDEVKKDPKLKVIKKRQSTRLEDELCPSDDSLDPEVKEEMQFLERKGPESAVINENVATGKLLKKKKSIGLDEELSPSEDSLDKTEKEKKEFRDSEKETSAITGKELMNGITLQTQVSTGSNTFPDKNKTLAAESDPTENTAQTNDINILNKARQNQISNRTESGVPNPENTPVLKKESEATESLPHVDINVQNSRKRKL